MAAIPTGRLYATGPSAGRYERIRIATTNRRQIRRTSIKAILVSLVLSAGACGGSSDGKDLAAIVGVWTPTSGNVVFSCAGQQATEATTALAWATGSSSDLIPALPNTSCVIHADVSAETAVAPDAQTCVVPGVSNYGDSITDSYTYSAYTFVLGADGKTATENFSGTLLETDNTSGTSATCTMSEAGLPIRNSEPRRRELLVCRGYGIRSSSSAFWACRRFSACCQTALAGPSITSSVISSPRWAGRQCRTMAFGWALRMSAASMV